MSEQTASKPTGQIECKVIAVMYTGGIIGAFSDQKMKLQVAIQEMNDAGYRLNSVLPPKVNILMALIQLICLSVTFLLWAPLPGETLIFERET